MYRDYQLSDKPIIRGIVLAFLLTAISGIGVVFGFIPFAGLLVFAVTFVPVRVMIEKIVIAYKNQILVFGIGILPPALIAVAGLVAWRSYPTDAEDPMGAVLPAIVGVNMAIFTLGVLVLGAWEIMVANRQAKTNNSLN